MSLRSSAPAFVKKIVWDCKYQNVTTDADTCPSDLLQHLASIKKNASVLDLGCGTGNLLVALRRRGWTGSYFGIDVSEQAIATGRKIGDASARWRASAIEDFKLYPYPGTVDVICLCESLYYVKLNRVDALLAQCLFAIAPTGKIYVRIVHQDRHRAYVERLKRFGAEADPPLFMLDRRCAGRC